MKVNININKASIKINPQKNNIELGTTYTKIIEGQRYEGEYEITPLPFQEQELQTKEKVLEDNIKVKEIPYYETSNLYGNTVYIGGN